MMHNEFTEISGQEVSFEVYTQKFEPMYMASNMTKHEFIEFMMPTIKEVAKAERKAREAAAAQKIGNVYLIRSKNKFGFYTDEAEVVSVNEKSGKMAVRYTGNFGIYLKADTGAIVKNYSEVKLLNKRAAG